MCNQEQETRKSSLALSEHAKKRSQQRSIPETAIDLLLDFGNETHLGGGVTSFSFRKKSWKSAAKYLGPKAKYFERYRACYVVVAEDGTIITVAYCH
jgi:hypothetical protein